MKKQTISSFLLVAAMLCVAGCQSHSRDGSAMRPVTEPAKAPTATPAVADAASPTLKDRPIIRIDAGASSPVKDSAGNEWLPDQGFDGGDVIERPGLDIANTTDAVIYQSEHYGMDLFSWKLPNGKYQVKLHFAETYEGIGGPGERVFSFNVQGHEFKDFDVWKVAGGPQRAYVVTVEAEVMDGQLQIKFISNIENPQINGIEIIPEA